MMYIFILSLLGVIKTGNIPETKFAKDEILVKFQPFIRGTLPEEYKFSYNTGITTLDLLNKKYHTMYMERLWRPLNKVGEVEKKFGVDLLYLIKFSNNVNIEQAVKDFNSLDIVEYAEPNLYYPVLETPNDPSLYSQWFHSKMQNYDTWDITHGDTSIIYAIVDSDCQWNHPDIEPNIWINEDEDINGDGKFTEDDINGVDEDGNGYVDDVVGWNFYKNTNDPSPDPAHVGTYAYGHGTHCFGDAIEATNNGAGGAGVGYNCRGIGFSCVTPDGNYVNTANAISAMYYAAAKGAKVMSLSWGSYSPNSSVESAINYCYSKGMLIFGAAGNVSTSQVHYPSGYTNVIAVAASNSADKRADWPDQGGTDYGSAFGAWIDITAPGDNIYATYPTDKYASLSGTSMASPVASGVAGLLWAVHPDWTNEQVKQQIFKGCDPMPDDTMYQKGFMGHGRVNSFNSVAPTVYANLYIDDFSSSDQNGNGYAEPGEEVNITITIANTTDWQNAKGVVGTLTSPNKYVSIINGTANFGDINAGSKKSNSSPFKIKLSEDFSPQKVLFYLILNSTPQSSENNLPLYIPLGKPSVLLVDDDGGDTLEVWYEMAMDSTDYMLYDYWDINAKGTPSSSYLSNYSAVVWFTGNVNSSTMISDAEQNAIKSYLDTGGHMVISSQNLGEKMGSSDFYKDYIHANYQTGSVDEMFGIGEVGDPIANGDTIAIAGTGGANNGNSNDGISPDDNATGIFKYKNTNYWGAIRYEDGYKLVYFSFPLEALDGSPSKYAQRWDLLRRSFEWFGIHTPEGIENKDNPVEIDKNSIKLYTNLTKGSLQLSIPYSKDIYVKIFNINGQQIKSQKVKKTGSLYIIHASETIPAGIYFLNFEMEGKNYTIPFYKLD